VSGAAPGRLLGVDPGLRVTGWGVVERRGAGYALVGCGTIRPDPSGAIEARLRRLHEGVRGLIAQCAPGAVAVEEAFGGRNVRRAIRLGEARAVSILAAGLAGGPVHEVPPALVKKSVAGHGRAGKEAVRTAVLRALGADGPDDAVPAFDAADALALALTALTRLDARAHVPGGGLPIGRRRSVGRRGRWTVADVESLRRDR